VIYLPLAYLGSNIGGVKGIFVALLFTYLMGGILSYITGQVSLKKILASGKF
jgi:hypothetical protein